VLGLVLALLTAALVLDMALAEPWTAPFGDPGTWVLLGVLVGAGLRGLGMWWARQDGGSDVLLRRLSLVVWGMAALGGLVSVFL